MGSISFCCTCDSLASQGKYDEADRQYLQCIEIQERALGPDHRNLAVSLSNRAELLQAQVLWRCG